MSPFLPHRFRPSVDGMKVLFYGGVMHVEDSAWARTCSKCSCFLLPLHPFHTCIYGSTLSANPESLAEGGGQTEANLLNRSSLGFHSRSPLHSNILKDQINQEPRRIGERILLALAAALSKLLLAVEDAALVRLSLPHALSSH
mmetsp:Transcript_11168/g.37953  ORF Transcript_11168/g.37953 Transcript_11168/m.37953 type:complete len:143 (+) Transcript_11168:1514-1942(+)